MFMIKELIGIMARKRRQLHLLPVRCVLILSCSMLLLLVWRGLLSHWSPVFRIFINISLLSDMIVLTNNRTNVY